MIRLARYMLVAASLMFISSLATAAVTVPMEVQMPGTQPGEGGNLESVDKCDNCHQDDTTTPPVTIAQDWRGSMMSHAGRDPIYWATVAIAEQDFDGAGDLCIRCHSAGGWMAGRSTPTDGSGLAASDDDGIDCDTCHQMTNPDMAEHVGTMNDPFIANQGQAHETVAFAFEKTPDNVRRSAVSSRILSQVARP